MRISGAKRIFCPETGGVADIDWQERNILLQLRPAKLNIRRGSVGSCTTDFRTARRISGKGSFARGMQKHKTFHQLDSRGRRQAGKRFRIANGKKLSK